MERKMPKTLKEIEMFIPNDWEEKKEVALQLERIFLSFVNKTQLDLVEGIIELCERENVDVANIDDYFPFMENIVELLKGTEKVEEGLF